MSNRRNAIYSLLILSLLGGLFSGRAILFSISYVLGGLLLLSLAWAWASVSWVRLRRSTRARRAQVGRVFGETFTARNNGLLPKLWLEIEDHSTMPDYRASRVVATMMPLSDSTWETQTVCSRRGEYQLGPITVSSGDPFGLFVLQRHISATSRVLVFPSIVPVHTFATPSGLLSGGDALRQRAQFVTTNAAGVREYAPGDSFNRIHWRSTARKNRLLVKEFELDPLADIWIFLDISAHSLVERPNAHGIDIPLEAELAALSSLNLPPSTEEYGVVIAASLAKHFVEHGRSLGMVTYAPQREVIHADRSPRQLNQMLELLAVARGSSDFDLDHMLGMDTQYLARGTTLVIITADQSETWVKQAHVLSRRGLRVIGVLLDPSSFGGTEDTLATQARLATFGAPTYVVRQGDNITAVLSQRLH